MYDLRPLMECLSIAVFLLVCVCLLCRKLCSYQVIVHTWRAIWLNPFATVLFTVCSAVTVECCVLYPCCVGVYGMFAVM